MMMAPLDREARVAGGKARLEKQDKWERQFVAMLGGSRRPITKDNVMGDEEKVEALIEEGKRFPWSIYVAVGMNGETIRFDPSKSKAELLKRFQKIGAVAGFCGVLMFNRSFRTYTRRLLLDPRAQEKLDEMSGAFLGFIEESLREEKKMRGEDAANSLAYAEVYVDPAGELLSIYYSFGQKDLPEPGWTKAGVVYLVDATRAKGHYQVPEGSTSSWVIRFKLTDEKFGPIMQQATKLFSKKLSEVLAAVAVLPTDKK
jgi:hypothetical protein